MTTRHIATTGNDTTGDGTLGNPWATFDKGCQALAAGDTLYARAGTYAPAAGITESSFTASGSSWASPVLVAAYPGEAVILRPTAGARVVSLTSRSYIEFRDLVLDATNVTGDGVKITNQGAPPTACAHHIRFRACEIRNAPTGGSGLFVGNDSTNRVFNSDGCEAIGCLVHHNGAANSLRHGIYSESSGNLYDGNTVHSNGGWGIQIYFSAAGATTADTQNNTVRNNTVRDNDQAANGSGGIVVCGLNNLVYNNVVYDNGDGISVGDGTIAADGVGVYNNTCYHNGYSGGGRGVRVTTSSTSAVVKNNVCYQNGVNRTGVNNYLDSGVTTVQSDNLNWTTGNTDPLFVNAAAGNFHLRVGSPCRDAAADLSATFPADRDGVTRVAPWDQGAYEYAGPPPFSLLPGRAGVILAGPG